MYKFYYEGQAFLEDNKSYLDEHPLEMNYFKNFALTINTFSTSNFLLKFSDEESILLIASKEGMPLLIIGDKKLTDKASSFIFENNLNFNQIFGEKDLVNEFLLSYKKNGLSDYCVTSFNDVYVSLKVKKDNKYKIEKIKKEDLQEIFNMHHLFKNEYKQNYILDDSHKELNNIYCIRENEKIVSMAILSRKSNKFCEIIELYTKKEYRHKGYGSCLLKNINHLLLAQNKIPYIITGQENDTLKKFFLNNGFNILKQNEICTINNTNIKKALFAGGCFWCMAKPYYEYDGVLKVFSGYMGGKIMFPTYNEVKEGTTGHKETVMIVYDEKKISYKQLLDIYLNSIDLFDTEGQFIDRGSNYTCAIFTSNEDERNIITSSIAELKQKYQKEINIPILKNQLFFKAEEFHQDFALKYPEKMDEEMRVSGRVKKEALNS